MPDRTGLRPVPSPTGASARSVRRRGCGPHGLPGLLRHLERRRSGHSFVSNIWVPTIRGEIEINRGNPGKAIELLQMAFSYEAGFASPWCPKCPLVATALLQLSVLRLSFLEHRRASATRQLRQTATKARMRSFVATGGRGHPPLRGLWWSLPNFAQPHTA